LKDGGIVGLRIRLADGHWRLGEHDEALRCLERAMDEDPQDSELRRFLERLESAVAQGEGPAELARPLRRLLDRHGEEELLTGEALPGEGEVDELPPLSSSTIAELFAEQGLTDKAVRVAEDVLGRNPGDERARRLMARLSRPGDPRARWIATLERWLGNLERRRPRRGAST
jgi:uncharacterized protein HemY